ncbi:MAG: hypothetical protein EOO28_13320 [Comamonadaceae bacterium]|nr:MAG: hypothetical protein EOO28_13320 [Comamonadaceae bacterium]
MSSISMRASTANVGPVNVGPVSGARGPASSRPSEKLERRAPQGILGKVASIFRAAVADASAKRADGKVRENLAQTQRSVDAMMNQVLQGGGAQASRTAISRLRDREAVMTEGRPPGSYHQALGESVDRYCLRMDDVKTDKTTQLVKIRENLDGIRFDPANALTPREEEAYGVMATSVDKAIVREIALTAAGQKGGQAEYDIRQEIGQQVASGRSHGAGDHGAGVPAADGQRSLPQLYQALKDEAGTSINKGARGMEDILPSDQDGLQRTVVMARLHDRMDSFGIDKVTGLLDSLPDDELMAIVSRGPSERLHPTDLPTRIARECLHNRGIDLS